MKTLKIIVLLTFSFLLTTMSCSSDDDGGINYADAIIGNWRYTSATENGENVALDACELLETLVINASQIRITEYFGNSCEDSDTFSVSYTLEGNAISLTDGVDSESVEILMLNDTTFTIRQEDEGDVYTDTYTRQ